MKRVRMIKSDVRKRPYQMRTMKMSFRKWLKKYSKKRPGLDIHPRDADLIFDAYIAGWGAKRRFTRESKIISQLMANK